MPIRGPERKTWSGDRAVDVYSDTGKKVGTIETSPGLFGGEKTAYHAAGTSETGTEGSSTVTNNDNDHVLNWGVDLISEYRGLLGLLVGVAVFFVMVHADYRIGQAALTAVGISLFSTLLLVFAWTLFLVAVRVFLGVVALVLIIKAVSFVWNLG